MLSALEQQQDQDFIHEPTSNLEDSLLTTAVDLKCTDGIVIGTDSQVSDPDNMMKSLDEKKIFEINDCMILGGAGDTYHTKTLVDKLREELHNTHEFSNKEWIKNLMNEVLAPLHKERNVELSERFGLKKTEPLFYPTSIIGAKLKDGFGLCIIRFNPHPDIISIEKHEAIGSGRIIAQFLLKQYDRWLDALKAKWTDVSIHAATRACSYTINEIKESDLYTGGKTNLIVTDTNETKILSESEIANYHKDYVQSTLELMSAAANHPEIFSQILDGVIK